MARKKKREPKDIDSIRHTDKRANIPTEELRGFVEEQDKEQSTMLYPRDPSLDPQLVWQGKDEQDAEDLAVPVVPVYIQEKIHPQAIIEDIRANGHATATPEQPSLFDDFNGLDFEQTIDFYQHEQNWANRMILGDSLQVLTSLAEKEGLKGQVQMIYLDPPYGIKFGSNWQVSTRKRNVSDTKVADVTRQPEQVRAFRDTWEKGIHSYLSYLRDRLVVAHELLTPSGSVFVQIGDENVHLVRCLLDEVFGSENSVSLLTFATTSGFPSNKLAGAADYILWYAKDTQVGAKYRTLYEYMPKQSGDSGYRWILLPDWSYRGLRADENRGDTAVPPDARPYKPDNILSQGAASSPQEVVFQGVTYSPGSNAHWKASFPAGMRRLARAHRIHRAQNSIQYIRFADDFAWKARNNLWIDTLTGQYTDDKIYVVQTNTKVIERCMLMSTDPGDLVLDPTCGSGTTAHVAEQWGRRWITIDTSRVALALARTRIMSSVYPYYTLSDSPEGIETRAKILGHPAPPVQTTRGDVKQGFVYKRAPHIMLKDIANNEEIDVIYERWQEKKEPVRDQLNSRLSKQWEEWEIPREPEDDWPQECRTLLSQWWDMRLQRQQEIDESIARNSEAEILYDQPYEDNKRVRVAGPFTVESLSPHRVLAPDEPRPASETEAEDAPGPGQFETMILENLERAGVQNTVKNERLTFDFLEPYAGQYVHAAGEYTEKDGTSRRAAVTVGPQYGTVGPDLVKDAAKEAVQGQGFDTLIVCGFSFDPHVSEEAKQFGPLTVLPARMNPDLSMGDELLKKTGAGNLFMIFGEPDIDIRTEDGKLTVEIHGLDIYDPTTGQIRSSSTDDIACWFIDTNYNQESFFVRHAYFLGDDEPYDRLKRTLRSEIDEEAWSVLYATTSRPFDPPDTGRIAVKIINHYGDEVLKVYTVGEAD